MQTVPYLIFNGNCQEALDFYVAAFGGKPDIMRYSDMPADGDMEVSDAWKDKIMHAELALGDGQLIYFSDAFEGNAPTVGDNVSVHIDVDSEKDVQEYFDALAAGGRVTMPVDKMFWGAVYGSLVDRFGIGWGFHYQLPG
jgi:PhnB protein